MKRNNKIRYSVAVIILLLIIGGIAKKKGLIGKESGIPVSIEKASKRTIVEIVSASGKIQPEVEVKISPDVSGEVVELLVKEGEKVKKGDLLIRIKPDIYTAALDKMLATVNSAKAELANSNARLAQAKAEFRKSEASYKRNKKLFGDSIISEAEFENIIATYEVSRQTVESARQSSIGAQFNVKSAEASLKEAQDNLLKTSIFSPVDGTISKLNVELGERVVGTSQMAGTELMKIANLNAMEVSVDVNENEILRIHFNDTASIEIDTYNDRKFTGIVNEIANSANVIGTNTDQVTNFTVKIRILSDSYKDLTENEDDNYFPFRPGMSATVDIQTKKSYNAISIPIQAVTTRDTSLYKKDKILLNKNDIKVEDRKTECLFLVKGNKAKLQAVTTGIQDNNYIEILNGLNISDEVIIAPYSAISRTLKEGSLVKVVPKEELFEKKEEEL